MRGVWLAMTTSMMWEFKNRLKGEKIDKRLIWTVATFAFWGSLRILKILSV